MYFRVSVNSMTLGEVKQLTAKLRQQIQGKESACMIVACENFNIENPL